MGEYPNAHGPVIFYLHGNGENIAALEAGGMTEGLSQHGHLYVPEYPGLGPLGGDPSQKLIMEKVRADLVFVRMKHPDRKLLIIGRSLGAAVAAQLNLPAPDGLLLISPWKSLREAARANKLGFLTRFVSDAFWEANAWDTESIAEAGPKVLIIHGSLDQMIPFEQGLDVAEKYGTVVKAIDSGHNDLFTKPEAWTAIGDFVGEI